MYYIMCYNKLVTSQCVSFYADPGLKLKSSTVPLLKTFIQLGYECRHNICVLEITVITRTWQLYSVMTLVTQTLFTWLWKWLTHQINHSELRAVSRTWPWCLGHYLGDSDMTVVTQTQPWWSRPTYPVQTRNTLELTLHVWSIDFKTCFIFICIACKCCPCVITSRVSQVNTAAIPKLLNKHIRLAAHKCSNRVTCGLYHEYPRPQSFP